MLEEEIRIFFTGGATGGHLFPLIFVKREIEKITKERNWETKFFYLGAKPINQKILEEENIKVIIIPSSKLRKYLSLENFIDILKFPLNFLFAFYYLLKYMPDVLFSKGGPGSLGVVLSAWILRIPIIIHDSDSIPGLTNKISSFFAKKIAISFLSAKKYFPSNKVIFTGQPIDTYLINQPIYLQDYERFGLNPEKKIILVLGGSQGSQFLNDLILDSLEDLLNLGQVVHQTGEKNFKDVYLYAEGKIYKKNPEKFKDYHPFPFLPHDDLIFLMKISDVIISRAGAGSIFEISAVGKPSILIPIEEKVAGSHQVLNAREYHKYGSCFVLEEKNAKPHLLISLIKEIFRPEIYEKMQKGAVEFAKLDASKKIADELINLLNL